jgi:hypothetical protein
MVFAIEGLESSIPKRMGILTGTKAHILRNLGINSLLLSELVAEFFRLIALCNLLNSA